ncbi:hypothetical protein CEK26_013247 [Fusarium fujikuroi]|nr:hypothetical protein CEK27_013261 [Fusarium fujikuroi]QGI86653.1 hypothetical protein CEK25_013382 [Fusarium fujikuroi]QGJ00179.1 hypothetical protein CEK26_013247 [Fusarium fujikuroi]
MSSSKPLIVDVGAQSQNTPSSFAERERGNQAELYYILSGSGEVEVEGKRYPVSKNNLVWIPGDAEHGVFCNDNELSWLYVFPEDSFDNIVYRFTSEVKGLAGKIKPNL